MSTETHERGVHQSGSRYICPLDGTPLRPTEDGWFCEHNSEQSGEHETILAYDTDRGCCVRQQGSAIMTVQDI